MKRTCNETGDHQHGREGNRHVRRAPVQEGWRNEGAAHDEWLAFRTKGVGGSDMGTILGLNPYSTPYDLWLEKTGRQQPEDISGKWAIVKGNALEVELRRRFRQLHPEYQSSTAPTFPWYPSSIR